MEEKKRNIKEIDILGIIKIIANKKLFLAKVIGLFALIGICVSLVNPKEYTSEVILAPEMNTGGIGLSESLSSMASTFGIDLGSKSAMDAIYPEIYPTVLLSNDFIISLMNVKVHKIDETATKRYYDYINQDLKIGFWGYPLKFVSSLFSKKEERKINKKEFDPVHLTKKEENIVDYIRGNIKCIIDGKTRIITIGFKDQDPQVAELLADTVQYLLMDYIIKYRTKKANNDLIYYQKLLEKSKTEYLLAQKRYTDFCDANMKIALSSIEAKRDELENEMQLKYNIYNQISTQAQQAKAKVQEQTPAFTIIQRATVPNKASSTPRSLIVIMYAFIGGLLGSGWILFGKTLKIKVPFRK